MSVQSIRICDQCNAQYDLSNPAWMTLSFPNHQEDGIDPVFDFCTYQCLQTWVNEDDDEEAEATQRFLDAIPTEERFIQHETNAPDAIEAELAKIPPIMSLAEAMANGLRPDSPR